MKAILLFVSLLVCSVAMTAQSPATATFGKEKGNFHVVNNSSITKFSLAATPEQLKAMEELIAPMGQVEFQAKPIKPGTYACSLHIKDTADENYVVKVFSMIGIAAISVNGEKQTLDALPALLNSLK